MYQHKFLFSTVQEGSRVSARSRQWGPCLVERKDSVTDKPAQSEEVWGRGKVQGEKGRGQEEEGLGAFVAVVVTDRGRRKKTGKEGRERAKERMKG